MRRDARGADGDVTQAEAQAVGRVRGRLRIVGIVHRNCGHEPRLRVDECLAALPREQHIAAVGRDAGHALAVERVGRDGIALEASIDGSWGSVRYRASYVLSRTSGNYTGLYSSDGYIGNPGNNGGLGIWHQAVNSTGLLPNDRPHVFKMSGTWRASGALEAGAIFNWMSGTPLNRFGAGPFGYPRFLAPRGSVGRTPSVMDLNLRASYRFSEGRNAGSRVVLDVLHVGNPQGVVRQDLVAYRAEDANGQPTTPNSDYLRPTLFQPPMMARLGIEIQR